MKFHATYAGHIRNAKKLLLDQQHATVKELAFMSDAEVEELISQLYVAVIEQEDALGSRSYEEIHLVPKAEWDRLKEYTIMRD